MLRLLRSVALCAVLVLVPLWGAGVLHPVRLHVTHAAFHNAWCACPLCIVHDDILEVSYGEYC